MRALTCFTTQSLLILIIKTTGNLISERSRQCYNPLGFVQPALLRAKMLMQDLCSRGLGWDETISPSDIRRWNDWLDSLPALQDVEILRCVKPSAFEVKSSQLHCLCDFSQTGYGVVIYMRSVSVTGEVHCSFIVARSRVASISSRWIVARSRVASVSSRWIPAEIMEAYSIARQFNLIPPTVEQAEYNFF